MSQWQKMIIDLKEQGLTQTQIATEINCSQNYEIKTYPCCDCRQNSRCVGRG